MYIMKTENRLYIDIEDMMHEIEDLTGLEFNHMGIWNSPTKKHLVIDFKALDGSCGYMRGEECFSIFTYLDEPWYRKIDENSNKYVTYDPWEDLGNPVNINKFLDKFGKSIYEERFPNSIHAISLTYHDIIELLIRLGTLPRGESVVFYYSW